MNDKEILVKSINKAVENGYKLTQLAFDIIMDADRGVFQSDYFMENKLYYPVIFSRKFAKSLWGDCKRDRKNCREPHYCYFYPGNDYCRLKYWEQHLQEMVIEKEPLRYLEKFIGD